MENSHSKNSANLNKKKYLKTFILLKKQKILKKYLRAFFFDKKKSIKMSATTFYVKRSSNYLW